MFQVILSLWRLEMVGCKRRQPNQHRCYYLLLLLLSCLFSYSLSLDSVALYLIVLRHVCIKRVGCSKGRAAYTESRCSQSVVVQRPQTTTENNTGFRNGPDRRAQVRGQQITDETVGCIGSTGTDQ